VPTSTSATAELPVIKTTEPIVIKAQTVFLIMVIAPKNRYLDLSTSVLTFDILLTYDRNHSLFKRMLNVDETQQ
jgi:hypothetical protein